MNALQPAKKPRLEDIIQQARKLGEERTIAARDIAAQNIPELTGQLTRRLVSQNVGASGGVGQKIQLKAIEDYQKRLDPVIRDVGLQTAGQELGFRAKERERLLTADERIASEKRAETRQIGSETRLEERQIGSETRQIKERKRQEALGIDTEKRQEKAQIRSEQRQVEERKRQETDLLKEKMRREGLTQEETLRLEERNQEETLRQEKRVDAKAQAERLFGLVESGQLTGEQAKASLLQQGINPDEFLTVDELEANDFVELKQQVVKDPQVAELIDNQQELDFFMEFGKTFDDEIADIMRTNKTIGEWKQVLPQLVDEVARLDTKILEESKKSDDFFASLFGSGRNDKLIEEWKIKKATLETAVGEIEGGKVPVLQLKEFKPTKGQRNILRTA